MKAAFRFYRLLTRLLPRDVHERHGEEMLRTLEEQVARAPNRGAVLWRAFRRFPGVLVLEWRDALMEDSQPQPAHSRGSVIDSASRLIRQGSRGLIRTPAFSLSVILLLGVGVGSVSAIFAVVDHVLLRRMPYPGAERMFVVENGSHSMPTFAELQSMPSVEAWAGATSEPANLTGEGDPVEIRAAIVTEGFFTMFAARPHIGRLLQASDYRTAETAVISFGTWVRLFGSDSSVVGRTIRINDRAVTVPII
jgi:hypothetical protein